jgi:CheY-like chemotaxis protein
MLDTVMGAGTTFHVYLPATGHASESGLKGTAACSAHGSAILTMDDEEMIRDAATEILEHLGYEVESSSSGGAGFGVVILDLNVKGGMGGAETTRKLKKIDPRVIGIVSSGFPQNGEMDNFREFGFSAAVAKPYTALELQTALGQVLRKDS